MICSVLCNINRDPKHHPEPYTPDDFLPRSEPPKPKAPPAPEQVAEKARNAMQILTKINE